MNSMYVRRTPMTLAFTIVALVAGCGDAPTEHEDEVEVHEVVISEAGTPVVTIEHEVVTGSLAVAAGDETPDYDIAFLDHDGNAITTGFAADATVQNTAVAIFHSTADYQGHFEGVSAGSTTVTVSLVHAADGDSHHDSPAIALVVN